MPTNLTLSEALLLPAGPELDALLEWKLFGSKLSYQPVGESHFVDHPRPFSSDDSLCLSEVVPKMICTPDYYVRTLEIRCAPAINSSDGLSVYARFLMPEVFSAVGEKLALAITRAALAASWGGAKHE